MRLAGLSSGSRAQLGLLLRDAPAILTPDQAAASLGVSQQAAAKRLAGWSRAGWLARVRRGVYVPVPIESASADVALEDPWSVAASMFQPCYVGGWTAAEHWGLTEQIFRSVCVMTAKRPRDRQPLLRGTHFELHTVPRSRLFGLKTVWRGRTRVQASDPARTLVDVLAEPTLGGGIRHVADVLSTLLREHAKEVSKLVGYAERQQNGAVFKRLGFLLQRDHADQSALIEACKKRLTAGYSKLDPALPSDHLVTAWRVWVSASDAAKGKI